MRQTIAITARRCSAVRLRGSSAPRFATLCASCSSCAVSNFAIAAASSGGGVCPVDFWYMGLSFRKFVNGCGAATCYGACASPKVRNTSRQSRATKATPPAARMRARNRACSGRRRPAWAFTSTPSKRPSRSCPKTSGHPGQPKRIKRLPTFAAPVFMRSAHATAGCVLSAFNTSTRAAASGRLLVRGVFISSPSKSVSAAGAGQVRIGAPL